MSFAFIQLTAVTRQNRLIATDATKDAIVAADGWIDDFHMYSNKMTCIRCQLPAAALPRLCALLDQAGIRVDVESRSKAEALSTSPLDAYATLQLSFVHDEPDLIREVPAIPG